MGTGFVLKKQAIFEESRTRTSGTGRVRDFLKQEKYRTRTLGTEQVRDCSKNICILEKYRTRCSGTGRVRDSSKTYIDF